MTLLRRLALLCLVLAGLAGCTEGQKSNPLPRTAEPSAKGNQPPDANPRAAPAGPREDAGAAQKD
jgi:hypothetical protein